MALEIACCCVDLNHTLPEETAHLTVYHHLSQLSVNIQVSGLNKFELHLEGPIEEGLLREKKHPSEKGAICSNSTTGALFRYPFF